MSRKIFQKPVSEVMDEYAPVYPESKIWTDTADFLLEHDTEIITELQRQFLEQGRFREPVVLKLNDPDEDTNDLTDDRIGYVADGTHRLVSAYLLGIENILVANDHEETPETDYSIVTQISNADQKALSDDENDTLFHKLRSICISDSSWITSSTGSGGSDGWSIYWDEYDTSLLQVINSAVVSKLEETFPETSFTVETICETWDF